MGAEVIKVEHESRWDGMRFSVAPCPPGGREERDVATGPIATPEWDGPNRSGMFMDINAGKLGLSLNLKNPPHPEANEIEEAEHDSHTGQVIKPVLIP